MRSIRASPSTMPPSRTAACIPGFGWVDSDYLGIDQGPILAMIENYRSDLVWRRDAQEPVRAPRPAARGLHGRLARRSRCRRDAAGGARRARAAACATRCARRRSLRARRLRPRRRPRRHASTSGRWAAKAKSSRELLAAISSARIPDIRVEVQQLPWTAAHEKLLTAFAGDAMPDVCQLGNTWIPEFAALGALEPLDAPRRRSAAIAARRLLRRHLGHRTSSAERSTACRGTSTRACCSIARDLLRARRIRRAAARLGANGDAMLAAVKAHAGAEQLRDPAAAERVRAAAGARAAAGRAAAARRRPLRQLSTAPGSGARSTSTSSCSATAGRRAMSERRGRQRLGRIRRAASSPSTSPGRGTSASSGGACRPDAQGDWATAPLPGPDGPGASIAGGSSLVMFRASPHEGRGLAADRVSCREPETQQRFHALTGDLPPRRSALDERRRSPTTAYARAFRDQLERVRADAARSRVGAHRAARCSSSPSASVRGELAVDGCRGELDARADAILEKRRWMLARGAAQ